MEGGGVLGEMARTYKRGEYPPHNEGTRRGISRNKKVYTPVPQDDDDKETTKSITRGLTQTKHI